MRRATSRSLTRPLRARRSAAAEDLRLQPVEAGPELSARTAVEISLALADELSQPLTAILATAQALQRTYRKSPRADPELQDAIADVARQAFRAGKIVQRMRTIVRRREARKRDPTD